MLALQLISSQDESKSYGNEYKIVVSGRIDANLSYDAWVQLRDDLHNKLSQVMQDPNIILTNLAKEVRNP